MRSISDTNEYKNICSLAAKNEQVFNRFKRDASYIAILEHVTESIGQDYFKYIVENLPEYKLYIDLFKLNDKYGDPRIFNYPDFGNVSPTTLRYIKVLSDLKILFGDLTNKKIVEIGVGYGGQCFILQQYFNPKDYFLLDIEEALALTNEYLNKLNTKHTILNIEDLDSIDEEFDLVISNYAYSELCMKSQDLYYEKIIKKSKHGYFTLNFISDIYGLNYYSLDQIKEKFSEKNFCILDEKPKTFEKNIILYF
jgi:putative sugar O-methyltransferase